MFSAFTTRLCCFRSHSQNIAAVWRISCFLLGGEGATKKLSLFAEWDTNPKQCLQKATCTHYLQKTSAGCQWSWVFVINLQASVWIHVPWQISGFFAQNWIKPGYKRPLSSFSIVAASCSGRAALILAVRHKGMHVWNRIIFCIIVFEYLLYNIKEL